MAVMKWEETVTDGGIFEVIEADTQTEVTSSVEANELKVSDSGEVKISGKLNSPYINIKGDLSVDETLENDELKISKEGRLVVDGDILSKTINNSGLFMANSAVRADIIKSDGGFKANGAVAANTFESNGSLQIEDELKAETVNIKVMESSVVRYLKCKEISVRAHREHLFFKDDDALLTCREIEGENIQVENVVCDVLRGDRIKIGKNCVIQTVEYFDSYDYDEASEVHEFTKLTRD